MPVLLCYGDSNTHGTVPLPADAPRARYPREVRWPGRLASTLGPEWHVIEEGLPGRSTCIEDTLSRAPRDGLAVLPAILETHRPVDHVVLMLGTNDTKSRFAMTADDIARGIERLAQTILSTQWDEGCGPDGNAPRLLIVSPPPCTSGGPYDREQEGRAAALSRELAEPVRVVAARLGADFLDAAEVAEMSPVDGVHLDEAGHAALAEAVAAALKS